MRVCHLSELPRPGPAPLCCRDSVFGKIASSYEECRAECSGLYLCLEPSALSIFGHEGEGTHAIHDVAYINWLLMVRAGLTGLEFFTPETRGWRQAHMRARYVILRVLLEAAGGLVSLEHTTGTDGKPDVIIHLDRSKITAVGKPAIGQFLLALQVSAHARERRSAAPRPAAPASARGRCERALARARARAHPRPSPPRRPPAPLQVHKSLADLPAGTELYERYSSVPPEMAELREIVMARKEPRKLLVQPHLAAAADGAVTLSTFDASAVGMVESFVARYPAEDEALLKLYAADMPRVAD